MKNVRRAISLCLFIIVSLSLSAQGSGNNGVDKEAMKEKMKALKTTFITHKLDLSPEEAAVFWPVYNLFEDEMSALRPDHKKPDTETLSDAELEAFIVERFNDEQKRVEVKLKYFAEFKKILPIKKIALLYEAEREFKKQMLQKLKEKGMGGPPPPQE